MNSRAGTSFLRRVGSAVMGVALLFGLLPRPVAAQTVAGTILGTVTDATGGRHRGRQGHAHQRGHAVHAHGHHRRVG